MMSGILVFVGGVLASATTIASICLRLAGARQPALLVCVPGRLP